jgi:hypothetical protein
MTYRPNDGRMIAPGPYFSGGAVSQRIANAWRQMVDFILEHGQLHRIDFVSTRKDNVYRPVLFVHVFADNIGVRVIKMPDIFCIVSRDGLSETIATTITHGHKALGITSAEASLVYIQNRGGPSFHVVA